MTYPWGHKRRYNAYGAYFRKHFGQRVQKVSVDAGFTCPNRDGTVGRNGCTYCNNDAFNPSYCHPSKPLAQQVKEGIEFHRKRYRRARKYLVYFQAYSNTYASLPKLKALYEEALGFPDVAGLVIGTRPDTIDKEKLNYLRHLNENHYIIIEYGIESCYDKTLQRIHRGHTFRQSAEALEMTAEAGIRTGAHLIFGLPGESREEMMASAHIVANLPINNIKFHQLQIIQGTKMARQYHETPHHFSFFTLEDYVDFIIDYIERIPPAMIIERFTGEVPPRYQAGPNWGNIRNEQIVALIEKKMEERNTFQGRLYSQKP